MARKKTHEEFIKEVSVLKGNDLVFIGKYNGSNNRLEVKCKNCGHEWCPIAQSLLKNGCNICANAKRYLKNKKSHSNFVDKLISIHGTNLEVIGQYINAKTNISLRCTKGHEFTKTPDCLINKKQGCPICSKVNQGINHRKRNIDFISDVNEKGNNQYQVIDNYVDVHTKIKFLHKVCNREFHMSPRDFLNKGNRCPKCAKEASRKTHDYFIKEIQGLYDNEFIILSNYKNSKTKLKIEHSCGHIYEASPPNLLKGRGCPKCKSSLGEKDVIKYINSLSLPYNKEMTFKDCVFKNRLRFDFYIMDRLLVEFDGRQHFYFNNKSGFGDFSAFLSTQRNDEIKNKYCMNNNIPLIRIPYKQQNNIEYILLNVLIHFGLINNKQDAYDEDIVLKYLVDENWDHDKYIEENKQRNDTDGK